MNSIWCETLKTQKFPSLNGDIKTDVLVIGGGITGILCAYMLKNAGVDYTLVEADEICSGITKNTTAKITSLHGLNYHKIIDKFGLDTGKMYFDANNKAIDKFREICKNIDCDFENTESVVYSLDDRGIIDKELSALQRIGSKADLLTEIPLPLAVKGAIKLENQAQFHPLKFLYAVSKNLNIYENTKVREIKGNRVYTNNGQISANRVIIATHFPFINKYGSYFLKLYQHRSYVIAIENYENIKGMYVDYDISGLSFRNYGDYLLIGGAGHRTGKSGGGFSELEEFAAMSFPKHKVKYRWATQDCMSLDGMPYVGNYSSSTPNIYVASGFNKWGMTSSMVSAMLLTDLICARENPLESVFNTSRNILTSQLLVNAAETVLGYITPTVPRCSHMGCALKYNKQEHSWDCPCHGSRFTKDKRIIDNPALNDMKKSE